MQDSQAAISWLWDGTLRKLLEAGLAYGKAPDIAPLGTLLSYYVSTKVLKSMLSSAYSETLPYHVVRVSRDGGH